MAYASWSVVFGEQPSAAKWNILGTNDASFNDGTGIFGLKKDLLTTDSNPYKFRASMNGAVNTGAAIDTYAVITFDTEQFDTNGNLSAGVYTAPVSGFYHFAWGASWATSGAETFESALFKNGTITSRGVRNNINTVEITTNGADTIQLTAADTVDVRTSNTAARALSVGNIYKNFFSGFLVSRT